MAQKFFVDDIGISDPGSVNFSREDIVSQDRTMNGNLVVDYVTTKKTINVKWDMLNDGQFQELLNLIGDKQDKKAFYVLKYYEPETGGSGGSAIKTMKAYTSGIEYYPFFTADGGQIWRDVSLKFVEV